MSDLAIEVNGLSKKFHIAALKDKHMTFQERLGRALLAPVRRIVGLLKGEGTAAADLDKDFWALEDVSFDVKRGEVVGIIGENGAGKSTLLKVLSRITEPTRGSAIIRGRFGSLLEVGTGFHPELTGRENVFLNGSILGMTRDEVARKFDEIIGFAEIGDFIDTPVKHYSSGMRVRLAFAVAANLDPDVLFVDEVLAVGDIGFQKKCREKVHEIAAGGATVLVVSHNAQAIISMCQRAVWLDKGKLVADGPSYEIVLAYLNRGVDLHGERVWEASDAPGGEIARLLSMRVRDQSGCVTNQIDVRESFCIELEIEVLKPGFGLVVLHDFVCSDGGDAFSSLDTNNPVWEKKYWPCGITSVHMWVPGNFLQLDTYSVTTGMGGLDSKNDGGVPSCGWAKRPNR